jgi:MurNAc alpha-1-phosphate uridylyltransferase
MIEEALGDGAQFGARITYSAEGTALETAGGVAKARHLLGEDPFVAIAADIYCPHFDYEQVKDALKDNDPWGNPHPHDKRDVAWLYLVKNPPHHPKGDFALHSFSVVNEGEPRYTFSGIGVYRMEIFNSIEPGQSAQIAPILRKYADLGQVGGHTRAPGAAQWLERTVHEIVCSPARGADEANACQGGRRRHSSDRKGSDAQPRC